MPNTIVPAEVKHLWNGSGGEFEVQFGLKPRKTFALPSSLLANPHQFDTVINVGHQLALDHAVSASESAKSLANALKREDPRLAASDDFDHLVDEAWDYVQGMADLIKSRKNSIWAFIIRNSYRPALLRGRFDVIVGNPPWLSYRYISDPEYQAEVKKRAVGELHIAPKSQKLFTQMELATVFLAHALKTFAKPQPEDKSLKTPPARLAFVMPRSVLSADQHSALRLHTHSAPVTLTEYWDLFDVRPVFNVPACVLFAERSEKGKFRCHRPDFTIPAVEWPGRLPERDSAWKEASSRLTAKRTKAQIVKLGSRNALTSAKPEPLATDASPYIAKFRDGATIYPRSFYFVHVEWPDQPFDPNPLHTIETDPEQARTAKKPYNEVLLTGQVEGRFLFKTAIARHVLPFLVLDPADIVLPVEIQDDHAVVRTARQLKDDGYRYIGNWMANVDREWARLRGKKLVSTSSYEWLNYSNKLTKQPLARRYLVLYNAAGTNLSAAVFDRKTCPFHFFVDHKLYYFATNKQREADFWRQC